MIRSHLACAALLCSTVARAQDKTCIRQPAAGQASVVVMGHLDTVDPTTDLPTPYLKSVFVALRDAFRASGPLPLVAFTRLTRDTATYAMTTAVEFEIMRDGRIQGAHLIATSLSRALDSIALGALVRVDSARSLYTLPRGVIEPAHLLFTTDVASDTGKRQTGDDVTGSLIRITAPVWTSFKLPVPKPYSQGPEYPPGAISQSKEDAVTAVFVIDELGMVVPSTVYLSRATYEEFGMSVVKWLTSSNARFRPGIVGGCPARMLVSEPFAYNLQSPNSGGAK